jgi:cystinosin
MSLLSSISTIIGWTYTLCWSLSFYSQLLLNQRRRSTSGTTVDFPVINAFGFLAYFAYTAALYFSTTLRELYAARNNNTIPTVQLNDVAFALHAFVLSVVTCTQYFFPVTLWRFPAQQQQQSNNSNAKLSRTVTGIILGSILGVLVTYLIVLFSAPPPTSHHDDDPFGWSMLDVVYAVSYVKLLITLVKFTPQVIANHRNKSTKGWAIEQILLDLAGGILSIAQIAIDSWLIGDWSGITGNPVKFALGNASFVYDAIFMTQHYVLYPQRTRDLEGRGLLDGNDDEEERRERRLD